MDDAVDKKIVDVLDGLDLDELDPNTLVASLIASDRKLSQTVTRSMENAIKQSMKSVSSAFKNMENASKKAAGDFSMGAMVGQSASQQKRFKDRYNKILDSALQSMEGGLSAQSKKLTSVPTMKAMPAKPLPKASKSSFKEDIPITIGGFTDKALDQLQKRLPKGGSEVATKSGRDKINKIGWLGKIAGAILAGLGAFALWKKLPDEFKTRIKGAFKDYYNNRILPLLGTIKDKFVEAMDSGYDSTVKVLAKLKLAQFGLVKPLDKLVRGTVSLVSKSVSKVVNASMKGISKVAQKVKVPKLATTIKTALTSAKNSVTKIASSITSKFASKGTTTGGKSVFKKLTSKLSGEVAKKFGLKVLKRIPGIGFLIGLWFAKRKLDRNDPVGALLEVASGLASSLPGVGTALSIGLDVFIAARDIKRANDPEVQARSKTSFWGSMKTKMKAVGKKITSAIWNIIPGFMKAFLNFDKDSGAITLKGPGEVIDGFKEKLGIDGPESVKAADTALQNQDKRRSDGRKGIEKIVELKKTDSDKADRIIETNRIITSLAAELGNLRLHRKKFWAMKVPGAAKEVDAEIERKVTLLAGYNKRLDAFKVDANVADDFIARPGQPVQKFNSKDTVIGAKSGGAFDSALSELNANFVQLANTLTQSSGQSAAPTIVNNSSTVGEPSPELKPEFNVKGDYFRRQRGTYLGYMGMPVSWA